MIRQQWRGFVWLFVLLLAAGSGAARAAGPHPPTPGGWTRRHVRWDAGWRFHEGDLPWAGSQQVAGWRAKRDPRGAAAAGEYTGPDVDTTGPDWVTVTVGRQDVFDNRPGLAWYRTVMSGPASASLTLHFAGANDNATVYVNGQQVGQHTGQNQAFDVPVGSVWHGEGPNVLAVLVENVSQRGWIGPVDLVRAAQTEATFGPARTDYDDANWTAVHLPDDYVIRGTPAEADGGSNAYLAAIPGWYRKTFTLPAEDADKRVAFDFDGAYRDSTVWVNGHRLGTHASGYTGFEYDATPYVHPGGRNVLVVRVDPRLLEGWWYEGGGLYRHVWLTITAPVHVAHWGTFVTSDVPGTDKAAPARANLTVQTTLENSGSGAARVRLESEIVGPDGKRVAAGSIPVALDGSGRQTVTQTFTAPKPQLWSLGRPSLYRLVTRITEDGQPQDDVTTTFGIRTIAFDPQRGFFLNGKHVLIQGTANHENFAVVGVALPDNLLDWRIRQLKAVGCNGYRTAHDPQAPEQLDACDRRGMLVMDENRHLGDTYAPKTPPGTPSSDLSDLRDMILCDRNHPSIILWSLCNEEGLSKTEEGARLFVAMRSAVRALDPTRPVTCAMLPPWGVGISTVEDVQGFNHGLNQIDAFHQAFPDKPTFGSEFRGALTDRGVTQTDPVRGLRDNYSPDRMAEEAWIPVVNHPFMAGSFLWTGFDYQGEPAPFNWPDVNGHFGMFDLTGLPKDGYYYYLANWTDRPMVHLFPAWNFAGREGQPISVWVYSNCDTAELFLNGKSLGAQKVMRDSHLVWSVPYAPGTLEVKGYVSGKPVADEVETTTGPPAALRLTAEDLPFRANGEDLALVKIEVVDAQGRMVPDTANVVSVSVAGPASLAGTSNGAPNDHVPPQAPVRPAFHGICVAVLRASDHPGPVTVTATSPGMPPATLVVQEKAK